MSWSFAVLVWIVCAGIGAAISNSKNRGAGEGLALGGLLGIIGLVIAVCLPRELPKAPPEMIALQCPRCNAVQNVSAGQPRYQCWQCHTTNASPGYEPAFEALAQWETQAAAPTTTGTRRVRCFNCREVQVVPDVPSMECGYCGVRMKLAKNN